MARFRLYSGIRRFFSRSASSSPRCENDDWQESQESQVEATTIPPGDPAESAIVATLPSADYTDSTGVGVVEVYSMQ